MSDISNHPTKVYFKLDLLGPSTHDMRKANKTKPKVRCENGWTSTHDNGPVAFGQAFKKFFK